MKKLLALFILLLRVAPVYGALPDNTTVWEARSAGSITNGGCFITGASGTDFTQQNAAQFSGTDLVLVTGNTATSVSHSFVATDVGNCINISAGTGFTVGFYEVVSVAAGTATLDQNAGTPGSISGTWAEGGGVSDLQTIETAATLGNTVWLTGTFTQSIVLLVNKDNRASSPFTWTGYTTTRGDNGLATITTGGTNDIVGAAGTSINIVWNNIKFFSSNISPGSCITALNTGFLWQINGSQIVGCARGINDNGNNFQPLIVTNTNISGCTVGISNGASTYVAGVQIQGCTGDCMDALSNAGSGGNTVVTVSFSVFHGCGGNGLKVSAGSVNGTWTLPYITNSVFTGNTGDGLQVISGGSEAGLFSWNSIYYNNGGAGINNVTGPALQMPSQYANAFGANTGGNRINVPAGVGDITLTASPWISTANNYLLNATAGGGAALKGKGFPGATFPSLLSFGTGSIDLNVLQSAGGGSSAVTQTYGSAQ